MVAGHHGVEEGNEKPDELLWLLCPTKLTIGHLRKLQPDDPDEIENRLNFLSTLRMDYLGYDLCRFECEKKRIATTSFKPLSCQAQFSYLGVPE